MTNFPTHLFNKTKIPFRYEFFKSAIIFGDLSWFDIFYPLLDDYVEYGTYKCMRSMEATYKGEKVLLYSFGYGFLDINRVVTESAAIGVKNIVYLNFSLPLKPDVGLKTKDLCIIYGSVRNEHASFLEVDEIYPAAAHPVVVKSLRKSAEALGHKLKLAKSIVVDGFYEKKVKRYGIMDEIVQTDVALKDWDSSPMLVFASVRKVHSAVLTCVGLQPNMTDANGEPSGFSEFKEQMELMAKIALDACLLCNHDTTK